MKRATSILLLVLVSALVLFSYSSISDEKQNSASTGIGKADKAFFSVSPTKGVKKNNQVIEKGVAAANVFVRTFFSFSRSLRNISPESGEAFFVSFFTYCRLQATSAIANNDLVSAGLQQRKMIFPYHYYW